MTLQMLLYSRHYRAVVSTDGEKSEKIWKITLCLSSEVVERDETLSASYTSEVTGAPPVLQLNSWNKLQDKFPLSHYHFPAMASMKDKEQRHFLGVNKASRQTDQMSHCNVLLGREANISFIKSCPDNGQSWKPFCAVPANLLQATPEQ